jgi:peptidoglycan/LPS O-acetylase OafA/YrhL
MVAAVVALRPLLPPQAVGGLRGDALSAALWSSNWRWALQGTDYFAQGGTASPLQHTWSLAVEEQFYLLWPVILVLVGVRRGTHVALAALLVCPILRTAFAVRTGQFWPGYFEFVADALAMGCVLAIWRPRLHSMPWYAAALRSKAVGWCPALVVCASLLSSIAACPAWAFGGIVLPAVLLGIAVTLDRVVTMPGRSFGQLLNHPWLVWLGGLSYSLYLWQQVFVGQPAHAWWQRAPVNLVLALGVALVSHRFIERPALAWRRHLHWPSSPTRRDRSFAPGMAVMAGETAAAR